MHKPVTRGLNLRDAMLLHPMRLAAPITLVPTLRQAGTTPVPMLLLRAVRLLPVVVGSRFPS